MILSGETAFYKAPDYNSELNQISKDQNFNYTYNTESLLLRKIKKVLLYTFFPLAIYSCYHKWVGQMLISSSREKDFSEIHNARKLLASDPDWIVKRMTINVNGTLIDAAIMGRRETIGNGRWMLYSGGVMSFYEHILHKRDIRQILLDSSCNILSFNYPGVGMSGGKVDRELIRNTYRAMLQFLKDQVNAKELICYGHSMGAGVQSDAISYLPKGMKVGLIKDRTYSDIRKTATVFAGKMRGFLLQMIGWNYSPIESSRKHSYPELIIQTGKVDGVKAIEDVNLVRHDDIIPKESSLAEKMLQDKNYPREHKTILAVPQMHGDPLSEPNVVANWIKGVFNS